MVTVNGYKIMIKVDIDIKCKNINDVHLSIQKKEKNYQLAKHTEILDYNDSGYCDIGNNIPDNYSSGMFSSLAYQDLKQAHTETIIPVNEEVLQLDIII